MGLKKLVKKFVPKPIRKVFQVVRVVNFLKNFNQTINLFLLFMEKEKLVERECS
jgi:hypothetical protein